MQILFIEQFLHEKVLLFYHRITSCKQRKNMVMIEIHIETFCKVFEWIAHGVSTYKSHRACILFSYGISQPAYAIEAQ